MMDVHIPPVFWPILFFYSLPIIIAVAHIIFTFAALIHIFKHPDCRGGNPPLWIIIVLIVPIIGPVSYFIIGKDKKEG